MYCYPLSYQNKQADISVNQKRVIYATKNKVFESLMTQFASRWLNIITGTDK